MTRRAEACRTALAALCGIPAQLLLGWLTAGWTALTGLRPPETVSLAGTWADWAWKLFLLAVIVPWAEEALFRGLAYGWLKKKLGTIAAGLSVTILFAAAHRSLSGLPAYLLFGLAAWGLREKSGSLLSCGAFHMTYNLCAFALAMLKI